MTNPFKTLLNTADERHAFIIGLSETLCPWPPRYKLLATDNRLFEAEYHYYAAGRACGFITLLSFIFMIIKLLWR